MELTQNAQPGQNAAEQPTVPAQQIPSKPIKTVRIGMYLLGAVCALAILSNIARFTTDAGAKVPRSGHASTPTVARPELVENYERQQLQQAEMLRREREKAQQELERAADLYANVLPCDSSLAGTRGTSPDGTPIVCGIDGKWHPLSTSSSGTGGAQKALDPEDVKRQHAAEEEAKRKRLERERHIQQALTSPTLAVDFTEASQDRRVRGNDGLAPASSNGSAVADHEDSHKANQARAARYEPISNDEQSGDAGAKPVPFAEHAEPDSAQHPKYAWDSYSGKLYRLFEGTIIETVLTNRINGALAGPINTMVTTDIWSHDHQKLLIPQGTRCFGTVNAVNSTRQQRLFVAFHRCVMPDGYSLDLDRFRGLNQIGETGLRDLVNHHYLSIFGTSVAIGAIGGIAQIGNGTTSFGFDPAVSLRAGISQETAQESMHILDRFLDQLPTFVVRERARVKIYLAGDLELPAYDAHTIDPTL